MSSRTVVIGFLLMAGEAAWPQTPPAPIISMDDAVRIAVANNQALRGLRLNIDQARANEVTAGLKPNPVYSMVSEDYPIFSPSNLTFANLRDNQEHLQSITYLFERGGKRQQRIQVSRDTTDVTAKTVAEAERQLQFQVKQAFIGVLLAKSNLDFATDDLKNFSEVVAINEKRWKAGDISEGDFLKISLQKLQFEQDVSAAQLALIQTKATLRQLLGYQNVPENYTVAGSLEHKKQLANLDELARQAVALRPDLQAAVSGLKLANDTVSLAYANRARDVTGESEYKRNGPINGIGFGVSIEIPIHNRNQGEIERSKFAVRQAQEAEYAARFGVLTDVANSYNAFQTNDRVLALYESGYLDQATKSRDITNYAYRRGAASLLDLLDAERSYRATQLAYRQALAGYMTSIEQVNLTVGTQVMK